MNADIRNAMVTITMDDGTEILGRAESLEMTRPVYENYLDDMHPQPICNQMVLTFDMFQVNVAKLFEKPPEKPPFDLDAMCNEALQYLKGYIDIDTDRATYVVRAGFHAAMERSDRRHGFYLLDHRHAISHPRAGRIGHWPFPKRSKA